MQRTIKEVVKEALAPYPELAVRVDSFPFGAHLHITTKHDGKFIGMITYAVQDNDDALNMMLHSLANWIETLHASARTKVANGE